MAGQVQSAGLDGVVVAAHEEADVVPDFGESHAEVAADGASSDDGDSLGLHWDYIQFATVSRELGRCSNSPALARGTPSAFGSSPCKGEREWGIGSSPWKGARECGVGSSPCKGEQSNRGRAGDNRTL